ncbi:MAG TPA: hypothetical protein VM512_00665 [Burkholderiaceae bacterium]|nr:hypothetical protein [Burkholderiaceae bacterium]
MSGSPPQTGDGTDDPLPVRSAAVRSSRPDLSVHVLPRVCAALFSQRSMQLCSDTASLRRMARVFAKLAMLNKTGLQSVKPYLATLREAHSAAEFLSTLLQKLDEGINLFILLSDDWQKSKNRAPLNNLGLNRALRTLHPCGAPAGSSMAAARKRMERYLSHMVHQLSTHCAEGHPLVGVQVAEQFVIDALTTHCLDWPATTPRTLLDNDKLFLCFTAVVSRDWQYEPSERSYHYGRPPHRLLNKMHLLHGLLPPQEVVLLSLERAILEWHDSDFDTEVGKDWARKVRQSIDSRPLLAKQFCELEDMFDFLCGEETVAPDTLNRLIDHLLREDALWGAADITLLLHLSVLTDIDPSVLAQEPTDIGRLDGASKRHVEAMNHLARFRYSHALRGTALQGTQIDQVEDALVAFMAHLCLLVPEHQPAGAWKHLVLIPQPLLVSAFLRLGISERVKIAASCPEWPDLGAVFRSLSIPQEDQQALARHFASTWTHRLSLTAFTQLGRWRDWMHSLDPRL